MMTTFKYRSLLLILAIAAGADQALGQEEVSEANSKPQPAVARTIDEAGIAIDKRLEASVKELDVLRAKVGDERVAMAKELAQLEAELIEKRAEDNRIGQDLASRNQSLSDLTAELDSLRAESDYLSTLLTQFTDEFDSRLHVVDMLRFKSQVDAATLAREDTRKSDGEKFALQLDVVGASLTKIEDAIGGVRVEGQAVANGTVKPGQFVLVGPTAVFRSEDGQEIGLVDSSSSEQAVVLPFSSEEDRVAAASLVLGTGGSFPLDVTLGNAQKVEAIEETWWEHVQKGGPIMIPLGILAGSALVVVLLKWLSMVFVRRPSRKQLARLLDCVESNEHQEARDIAAEMPGPGGRMLQAGAEHLGEPRDLIEEVMFEKLLAARLKLQGWLPFVAICATSAPLLGLLGTVTGIMGTFALMTEFGAGDPKILSSGISEALVTTEHGLIVAIPSLLLYAFLNRKARSFVDGMEKMALQFMNRMPSEQVVKAVATPEPLDAVQTS